MTPRPVSSALCTGMAVFGRAHDMVGVVDGFAGPIVTLSRRTGLTWQSRSAPARPGAAYGRRQLRAIGALHRLR
ncbi:MULTISPECIES: hypothetical protein [unclassified Streptomyces]|uniref:hypothetical protein n=1 Tax=unclassified Streptomyces TaxID=2593676 RepID=UPI0022584008|nr:MULTISPECIES: hypothetical protein [unclassified Streptomyces]MCX4786856.1 hypothetical protein [Streptomyces sp. NBC_01221]WSJ38661.1 hypothetical protein OG772_23410 [Streptomyces sp. NBC_01321]WSP64952.1 hypothetical protein OG466_26030 [Streptomyces sp. NBC_01240]